MFRMVSLSHYKESTATMSNKTKIICLLGATGSNKTRLALNLAREFNGAVLNIDSRQVYDAFPIITAQPDEQQKSLCPHYLYGFLPVKERLSVGNYLVRVKEAIDGVIQAGQLPILVGGTGMYIRSITEGIASIPHVPKEITLYLRTMCTEKGITFLYDMLQKYDLEYTRRIHPHDRQRILRALEVCLGTEHTFSWWHTQPVSSPYHALKLGTKVTLDELRPHLEQRIEIMLEQGAVSEVEKAYAAFPDSEAPGWSGIGCRELLEYRLGNASFVQACEAWRKNTRAYAKRQLTWFAKEPATVWFPPCETEQFLKSIQKFLSTPEEMERVSYDTK